MKLRQQTKLLAIGAFLLPLLVFWVSRGFWGSPAPPPLGITLIGVESDPVHRPITRSTVLNGVNGLSAIFALTNLSQDAAIWFDTGALEQRVGDAWRSTPVPAYSVRVTDQKREGKQPWCAIASADVNNVFPPGTCWNFVVAWPPDLPTNATWRLRLRYGRQPSPIARRLDAALGLDFFAKRQKGESILTPEVSR